ncbi:MAG: DnaK suppressor protein [Acidimicrobiales bacterium]|nr:DnaK suppressor protein [Acidimicrobiales bacterium]
MATSISAAASTAPSKRAGAVQPPARPPSRTLAAAANSPSKRASVATKKAPAAKKAAAAKGATGPKKSAPAKQAPAPKKAPAAKKASAATKSTSAARKPAAKKAAPAKRAAVNNGAGAAKSARRGKAAFSDKFLEQQRLALLDERATYTRQAESLQAEADSLIADFEPGDVQFDEESGEGDTLNIERERDLALSAQARAAVEQIDHALGKFDLGTYGICEVSGDPIPRERLEAIPWARERVQYKTGGIGRR